MRPLIFATLAMFSMSVPALAQPQPQPQQQNGAARVQPESNPQGNLAGAHTKQTGADPSNPAPHIYRRGEHISPNYGSFEVVGDWSRLKLAKPPEDSHWVKYGDNYLLVKIDSGQITDIVKAS
jgi:Ni/Co efflux regulator RcnB